MRNYVLFWLARGIDGFGTQQSFVATGDRDGSPELLDILQTWLAEDPGRQVQFITPAYVLLNKASVIAMLQLIVNHYPNVWASSWGFLQDGLRPLESPRDTWSHGD